MAISLSTANSQSNNNSNSQYNTNQQANNRSRSNTNSNQQELFKVLAIYDFNPTEEGELPLKKGQVIDVYDNTTFEDWWKGKSSQGVGIFPSNYVTRILPSNTSSSNVSNSGPSSGNSSGPRMVLDENHDILSQLNSLRDFKKDIQRADPLGHSQSENERLQVHD